MAANLADISTITPVSDGKVLDGTGPFELFENASASEKIIRITKLRATNVDGTSNQTITVLLVDNTVSPGAEYALASTITVPADAALEILDGVFYLPEGFSIVAQAGGANDIEMAWSYEELS